MPTINLGNKRKKQYRRKNEGDNRIIRRELYNMNEWKQLSRTYRMKKPLCEKCLENGIITPAQHVHHITSFMRGRTNEEKIELLLSEDNLMSLCVNCHTDIHNKKKNNNNHNWS